MVSVVRTPAGVEELARELLSESRSKPWAVIAGRSLDPEAIEHELGDVVAVFVIANASLTWRFAELLPPRTQVYGDAGRVYPVGDAWQTDPFNSPLRMVREAHQARGLTQGLISDGFAMAQAAGLFGNAQIAGMKTVADRVSGVIVEGERALVALEDGGSATLQRRLITPLAPIEWAVHPGLSVAGKLDIANGRLLVDIEPPSAEELELVFPSGSVTSALVVVTDPETAVLVLHPQLRYRVHRPAVSPNPLDRMDFLLSPGEVVAVRIVRAGNEHGAVDAERGDADGDAQCAVGIYGISLSMVDVDDDEPVLEALALLPGGRPWLIPDRNIPAPPEEPESALSVASAVDAEPTDAPARHDLPETGSTRVPASLAAPESTPEPSPTPVPHQPIGSASAEFLAARVEITRLQAELHSPAPTDPTPTNTDELMALRRETVDLNAEIGELQRRLQKAEADLGAMRPQLRAAKKAADRRGPAGADAAVAITFADDDEWVRHEIYTTWMQRYTPSDRAAFPLTDYLIGTDFALSVRQQASTIAPKIWRCAVDAVTGRWKELPNRAGHALRDGDGGGAKDVIRASDGAHCYRLYVESHTPSARRMHIWLLSGTVELSRVVLHDDMTP